MTLIAVLDYGIGNLRSAQKALQHVGADARLTRDAGLVRSLAETCQGLGIDVVAKWVEEKQHVDMLLEIGINYAQGFYFGRPGPKPEYIPPKE